MALAFLGSSDFVTFAFLAGGGITTSTRSSSEERARLRLRELKLLIVVNEVSLLVLVGLTGEFSLRLDMLGDESPELEEAPLALEVGSLSPYGEGGISTKTCDCLREMGLRDGGAGMRVGCCGVTRLVESR